MMKEKRRIVKGRRRKALFTCVFLVPFFYRAKTCLKERERRDEQVEKGRKKRK